MGRVPLRASNEEDAGEDEGDAEEAGEGEGVGREVHEGEVIENGGAGELAGDYGCNEGGGTEFGGKCGAAEDDESAEWSTDPIPPWCGTEEGCGGEGGADDEHDNDGAQNGAADGEEGGPADIVQMSAQRRIGGGLNRNASASSRSKKYPNKKHAGLE